MPAVQAVHRRIQIPAMGVGGCDAHPAAHDLFQPERGPVVYVKTDDDGSDADLVQILGSPVRELAGEGEKVFSAGTCPICPR